MHTVSANFQSGTATRHETFEGVDHLVVPVVMLVEGVLNDALVPYDEFSRYPAAWNGRPVPVYHPEENGGFISAARPDVIERSTIGHIFNAKCEGAKLKAEAWINIPKAQRLGFSDLLAALESGQVVEVSTGYFSDDDVVPGEFNGASYSVVHRNIRPDHLALLPGQIGACSVADGCGTRVNTKKGSFTMKVKEALATLAKATGLNSNCQCEEQSMDIIEKAKGLVKTNALDPKQLASLQAMTPDDRAVMAAFIAALGETGEAEDTDAAPGETPEGMEGDVPDEEKKPVVMAAAVKNLDEIVANAVASHLARAEVMAKLTANASNKLTEAQMKAMSVEALESVEKMIRPADYSGQGGFATNSSAIDTTATPMLLRGIAGGKKKEA